MSYAIREFARVSADQSVSVRNTSLPPGADVEVIVMLDQPPHAQVAPGAAERYSFLEHTRRLTIDAPSDFSTSFENDISPRP